MLCHAAADKGDLLQVIVAEDLFERIGGDSAKLLMRATYKAARRWAGQDEVARARMMSFLYDACPSARHFMRVCPDWLPVRLSCQCLRVVMLSGTHCEAHDLHWHIITVCSARLWACIDRASNAWRASRRLRCCMCKLCGSLQDPEDDRGIMEGLQGAAAAVQAADFARAHERLLDQPGSTPVEVMQELKQAAKVITAEVALTVPFCPQSANAAELEGAEDIQNLGTPHCGLGATVSDMLRREISLVCSSCTHDKLSLLHLAPLRITRAPRSWKSAGGRWGSRAGAQGDGRGLHSAQGDPGGGQPAHPACAARPAARQGRTPGGAAGLGAQHAAALLPSALGRAATGAQRSTSVYHGLSRDLNILPLPNLVHLLII